MLASVFGANNLSAITLWHFGDGAEESSDTRAACLPSDTAFMQCFGNESYEGERAPVRTPGDG